MHWVDFLIVAGILFFVYTGAKRGLILELRGLTGLLIAFLGGLLFYQKVGLKLAAKAPGLPAAIISIIAFIVVVVCIRLLIEVFIILYEKAFGENVKATANKFFGALFGFLQGIFFIGILTLAVTVLPVDQKIKSVEDKSMLFKHMTKAAVFIIDYIFEFVPPAKTAMNNIIQQVEKHDVPMKVAQTQNIEGVAEDVENVVKKVNELPSPTEVAAIYEKEKKLAEKLEASSRR